MVPNDRGRAPGVGDSWGTRARRASRDRVRRHAASRTGRRRFCFWMCRFTSTGRTASRAQPNRLDVAASRSPSRAACQLAEALVVKDADVAWARRVARDEVMNLPPHRHALHEPALDTTRDTPDCVPAFFVGIGSGQRGRRGDVPKLRACSQPVAVSQKTSLSLHA